MVSRPIRKARPRTPIPQIGVVEKPSEPRSIGSGSRNLPNPDLSDRGLLLAGIGVALEERIRLAQESFDAFATFALRDNFGNPVVQAAIHRVWHAHVEATWAAGLRAGVLAPYGHGKTQQLIVGRVAWEMGRDLNRRVKIVSNVDARAMERLLGVSSLIRSRAYRLVFPNVRQVTAEEVRREGTPARWTQHELYLARPGFAIDPSVQAVGVTASGTGGRADDIFFDDVVDEKNALQEPAMREKVSSAIDNVWLQRLEPNGRTLYVGTPWHQADYSHRIRKDRSWCVLRQWISSDQTRIHQEVDNPPENYPLPIYSRINGSGAVERAATWV